MATPGNTPLIEVEGIFAKLECVNPCGSVKDRIAKHIIEKSEERGELKPGMTIVEATSGNTGIAFSYYGRKRGYPVTIVMPENMTRERKELIRGLGATLILCSAEGSFAEAVAMRDELAKKPGFFCPDQFSNPLNAECHCTTTGREILRQMQELGKGIDVFVAGVGTGGTLMGVARAVKEVFPRAVIVAVEPSESAVMSGGKPGSHSIQGIGDGFIPRIVQGADGRLDPVIDAVHSVSSAEAKEGARHIEEISGCCVGISSGANFTVARRFAVEGRSVVTVFPDGFERYASEGLKHCVKGRCRYEHLRNDVLREIKYPKA